MDSILDLIQLLPDHHVVPIAVRILPVIAQDIRTVSVVRASLLSLIALSPAKLPICSDILREMQGDSRMNIAELPFWAAVAQEPGSPLGTIGVFSLAAGESDAQARLLAQTSKQQQKCDSKEVSRLQTKKKGAAAALLKGLRSGEVSKLVDGMEAQMEASDVKEPGMLVGVRIAPADLSEHRSNQPQCGKQDQIIDAQLPAFGKNDLRAQSKSQQPESCEQEVSGLKAKKKGAAALLKGLKSGEVSKLVDGMEAETQEHQQEHKACLDKRFSFADHPTHKPDATFADFWKLFEDMPMLDRFTISLQEEELKKMRQAGTSMVDASRPGWISREVELESSRKELRALMDQGSRYQVSA